MQIGNSQLELSLPSLEFFDFCGLPSKLQVELTNFISACFQLLLIGVPDLEEFLISSLNSLPVSACDFFIFCHQLFHLAVLLVELTALPRKLANMSRNWFGHLSKD